MSPKNKKEEETSAAAKHDSRSRLLKAARKLFSEHGYHATRPQDISREAGVGYGTFYLQFEDKLDCFMAFTAEAADQSNEFVAPYLARAETLPEKISAILEGSLDFSANNPGILRAVLEDVRVLSIYERSPDHRGAPKVLALLEDARQKGVIDSEFDSRFVGYLITGVVRQADALINQKTLTREVIMKDAIPFITRGLGYGRSPVVYAWDKNKLESLRAEKRSEAKAWEDDEGLTPAQRKNQNRRKLFVAARGLFAKEGYDAVGPKEIAAAAGVGMGTFYSHFDDKLDCFLSITSEASAELLDLTWRYVAAASTFEEMVHFFMRASFDYSADNPGMYRAVVADMRILQTDQQHAIRGIERTASYIESLKLMGKIEHGFDSKLLAYLITGTLRQCDAYIGHYPDRREKVIENATRFVLNAISAR